MVNYEKSKAYKIWSTAGDKIYIGSTTKEYLSQRMDKHRGDYKRWKNGKHPLTTSYHLFEEYGVENCFIELFESKVCNSKDELKQLEGKYIRSMVCVNKNIAGRTMNEYYIDNKEHLNQYYKDNKEHIKQYREDNKETIREKKNKPFECECGGKYTNSHKASHLRTTKYCQFINSLQ